MLKKPFPSAWNINKRSSKTFYKFFIKRHPSLSLGKKEATSLARATNFNKANELFCSKYKELLAKYNIASENIYNVDESGMSTVHAPLKFIGSRGINEVRNIASAERGNNVAVIRSINALGNCIAP